MDDRRASYNRYATHPGGAAPPALLTPLPANIRPHSHYCEPSAGSPAYPSPLCPAPRPAADSRPQTLVSAAVVKAVLLAALYPNVAVMDDEAAPGAGAAGPRAGWHIMPTCKWFEGARPPRSCLLADEVQVGRQLPTRPPNSIAGRSQHAAPPPPAYAGKRPGWHDGAGEVAVHPSSVCHPLEAQQYHRPYLVYLEKVGPGGSAPRRYLLSVAGSQAITRRCAGALSPLLVACASGGRFSAALPHRPLQQNPWAPHSCMHAWATAQAPLPVPPSQVRTSRTFIRDCTTAAPAAILLFGGSLSVAHDSAYVQVDGWLRIR